MYLVPSLGAETFIEAFVTVQVVYTQQLCISTQTYLQQLHAVTELANQAGTNFYSTSWTGPAPQGFDALGGIAALDVLNPAFSFLGVDASRQVCHAVVASLLS